MGRFSLSDLTGSGGVRTGRCCVHLFRAKVPRPGSRRAGSAPCGTRPPPEIRRSLSLASGPVGRCVRSRSLSLSRHVQAEPSPLLLV